MGRGQTTDYVGHVTAIHSVHVGSKRVLLIGSGHCLIVADPETHTVQQRISCLEPGHRIHGIRVFGTTWLAFGSRFIRRGAIVSEEVVADPEYIVAADAIADVALIDKETALIGYTHHAVHYVTWNSSEAAWKYRAGCDEPSLISTMVIRYEHDDVYVISATVYNQILEWKTSITDLNTQDTLCPVLYRYENLSGLVYHIATTFDAVYMAAVSDDRTIKVWDHSQHQLLHSSFGHTSRVFSVAFVTMLQGGAVFASGGEDGTVCLWHQGTVLESKELHAGPVWSLHVEMIGGQFCIHAGCYNGGVYYWETSLQSPHRTWIKVPQDNDSFRPKQLFIRDVYVMDSEHVTVVLNSGSVRVYHRPTKVWTAWKPVCPEGTRFVSSSCLGDHIIIAASDGSLLSLLWAENQLALDSTTQTGYKSLSRVAHTGSSSVLLVQTSSHVVQFVSTASGYSESFAVEKKGRAHYTSIASLGDDYVLSGTTHGTLFLFQASGDVIDTLALAHGKAIIDLYVETPSRVLAAGLDGSVSALFFDGSSIRRTAEYSCNSLSIHSIVSDSVVHGFFAGQWILWDFKRRIQVVSSPSKGGQRPTAVSVESSIIHVNTEFDAKQGPFICIEEHEATQCLSNALHAFHTRTTTDICGLSTQRGYRFVTAGDDSAVTLHCLDQGRLMTLHTLTKQRRNAIRCLAAAIRSDQRHFVATGGAFRHLAVYEIVNDELQLCVESGGRSHTEAPQRKIAAEQFDTRIMSTAFLPSSNPTTLLLVSGDSLGRLSLHLIDTQIYTMTSVVENVHHPVLPRPFLSLKAVGSDVNYPFFLSGDTAGRLVLWKWSGEAAFDLVDQVQAHQSGVNCIDCIEQDNEWIVSTGGDDQTVSIARLQLSGDSMCLTSDSSVRCHGAGVQGVCLVEREDALLCCSVGSDHRYLVFHPVKGSLQLQHQVKIDVDDASGLAVCLMQTSLYGVIVGAGASVTQL